MIDKVFEAHGLPCLVATNDLLGNFCGYVGVPKGNPRYGKTCAQIEGFENYPSVHGGITFAGRIEGSRDDLWWFGFDCGHAGDYIPGLPSYRKAGFHRWTVSEVADETRRLAKQLAEVDHA